MINDLLPLLLSLTHWLLPFLEILVVYSMYVGQISMVFHDNFACACAEIKIWSFWSRKSPTCKSLGFLGF